MLLGELLARERPQPRPRAAAEDDGDHRRRGRRPIVVAMFAHVVHLGCVNASAGSPPRGVARGLAHLKSRPPARAVPEGGRGGSPGWSRGAPNGRWRSRPSSNRLRPQTAIQPLRAHRRRDGMTAPTAHPVHSTIPWGQALQPPRMRFQVNCLSVTTPAPKPPLTLKHGSPADNLPLRIAFFCALSM